MMPSNTLFTDIRFSSIIYQCDNNHNDVKISIVQEKQFQILNGKEHQPFPSVAGRSNNLNFLLFCRKTFK